MFEVKYPEIEVQLLGSDGNAYMILGLVRKELRRAGVPTEEIEAYTEEATSGDYNHLLKTTAMTVEVS